MYTCSCLLWGLGIHDAAAFFSERALRFNTYNALVLDGFDCGFAYSALLRCRCDRLLVKGFINIQTLLNTILFLLNTIKQYSKEYCLFVLSFSKAIDIPDPSHQLTLSLRSLEEMLLRPNIYHIAILAIFVIIAFLING